MPIIFSTTTPASPACQPPARIYFEAPDDALLARVTEKVAEMMGRHLSYIFHDEAPGGVTPIILEDVGPSALPVETNVVNYPHATGVVPGSLLLKEHPSGRILTDSVQEDAALVCDYCGALTPDPWHSSGMLHGKMSKHIHSCDACAAPGVGNSGFDHQTAADFLSGKTVSDEAVRKFVQASRWAHDEKASLSAMLLSVRGELASREAEIALLKRSLLDAEADAAAPQPSPPAQAAESVPAVDEREQERIAFKDAHRHLELDEVPDAWGRPMFNHSHVEASWLGWIARASHGQAPAQAAPAAVLHLVHSAFAEVAMAFPKAFALHKVGIADTAVREALAAPATQQAPQQEAQEPVATLHCNDIGYVWARATEVGTRMRFEQPINLYTAPQPAPAPLSESIDQLERALATIGVVGAIDGHDVVRRESVLEIARRAALATQGGKA